MTMPTRATGWGVRRGGPGEPPLYRRGQTRPVSHLSATAIGLAIATLARGQLAGIGAGIAFYFGETFATIFVLDIVKYMPFAVTRASVAFGAAGRYL